MNYTIECPQCGGDMHLDIVDENGAHYECPNCDFEWCDREIQIDINENDDIDEDKNNEYN